MVVLPAAPTLLPRPVSVVVLEVLVLLEVPTVRLTLALGLWVA